VFKNPSRVILAYRLAVPRIPLLLNEEFVTLALLGLRV